MSKKDVRGGKFCNSSEENLITESGERAMKQSIALQLQAFMRENKLTKKEVAIRMGTSRSALDRLLDGSNSSVTLATLAKVSRALGQKITIELSLDEASKKR